MLLARGRLRSWIQFCLKCAGKGDQKIASVFSVSASAAQQAVVHLRAGAPEIPIWLFTTEEPLPETEVLCARVFWNRNPLALVAGAQKDLWPCWVAIGVGTWTGTGTGSGAWAVKLAPFLTPPFRVLILNGDGGFFRGTAGNISIHAARGGRDAVRHACARTREAIHAVRVAIHDLRVKGQENIESTLERARWAMHPARVRAGDLLHGVRKLSAATALRAAATGLRWMSNPHLNLFVRLHGDQPLMLDVQPSEGNAVIHFRHHGPHWDAERLEQLARSSSARWVLWHSGNEADRVSDGAGLFVDHRTFAASRQAYFRGWKKAVAATAPFRTLQAGEATRVLAPLADSILVDRKKLLALGIPRCSMPGTAWLILFWKAAAAGWRSYSIGPSMPHGRSLPEQPEFPIQDTAFVLQTLSDPALRRLCPRQEDLSRGNIAFRTADFAPVKNWDSERLKVLIVSPFLPYPLSHGGAVRIFNLCRALKDRVDFTLVAMREANDVVDYGKLHEVFREVHIVDKDERTAEHKTLPAQVAASESSSLRALITQLSQKLLPDLIQFEYTHFAGFRNCAPGVPALLVEHDLTFSLYRQLAEANSSAEAWKEYRRWLGFERRWLASYEGVWTVSEEDRLRAMEEGHRAADRTFTIANGVDLARFHPGSAQQVAPEVFYVGSFRHLPNIIGFEKLCDEIMPRVWAKTPDARLRVVAGPEHERYWRHFGRKKELHAIDSRVVIHGFVEDLQPLYDRATVVAVPLEVSAGTNIKVLEAMACGKAIVSTPVGCAGLNLHDGFDVVIRKDWAEFADEVHALLEARSTLGVRARRTAESYFSWNAIADRAYESYLALAGRQVVKSQPAALSGGALLPAHTKSRLRRRLPVDSPPHISL